ncbi:MAG: sigma-70 family RNA polymerase sigma factor [Acidobacteriota bacterium]
MAAVSDELLPVVGRIAGGDPEALSELHRRAGRLVFGMAVRALGRADLAEEVAADVFAQVWQSARRFDARRGTVEAWLVNITRSRAIDRHRSLAARPDLVAAGAEPLDDDLVSPAMSTAPHEVIDTRRAVQAMLQELAPDERRLIHLAYRAGYTHEELAARLGLPLGTIKTRIRASLRKMRRRLSGDAASRATSRRCPA